MLNPAEVRVKFYSDKIFYPPNDTGGSYILAEVRDVCPLIFLVR